MGKKTMAAMAESLKALRAMLDAFYAMALMVVNAILAPLRALGLIGGGPTAAGVANAALAQAAAEDEGVAVPALYDVDMPTIDNGLSVAASVWCRALELRGMIKENNSAPLPPEVEAWVLSLTPAELKSVSTMPAVAIARHLAAVPAGTGRLLPPYRGGVEAKVDPVEAGLALARAPRRQARVERPAYDPAEDTRSFAM